MPSRLVDDEIIPDNVDRLIYIQGARGFAVIIHPDHKEGALTKRLLINTISLFASFCFRARAPEAQTKSERDKSLVLEI